MVEAIFPPSSNWYFSKIISTREDGSVAYGSQNNIFVIAVKSSLAFPLYIIDAHKDRIKSVAFRPKNKNDDSQNLILSSSDDGFVKIWDINSQSRVIGHKSHSMPKDVVKVVCAAWSPCNPQYAVSAAENDTLVLWNTINNTTTIFNFPKMKPSVIECSYHSEKILAVGSRSGMVFIVQLTGRGEIIHRLRGHDKEIQGLSWSPILDLEDQEDISQKCLLASSSQEKEIFIWQAEDGDCLIKLQLPKSSLSPDREHQHVKWDHNNTFIPIFWSSPDHLYSTSKSGELICCDPALVIQSENKDATKSNIKKGTSNYWKLASDVHTNALLAIAGVPQEINNESCNIVDDRPNKVPLRKRKNLRCIIKNGCFGTFGIGHSEPGTLPRQGLIWTIGRDMRLVAVGKNHSENPEFYFNTINGTAFVSEVLPIDPHVIAIGAGDGKIRRWNVTDASGEAQTFGQKINDRVYSLAWHLYKESVLAFGTSEGRVGIIDVYSLKPPSNFMASHGGKVYRLSWGPAFMENEEAVEEINFYNKRDLRLYSVGGYKIMWHNAKSLKSAPLKINSDVPCKKFVDLFWNPDLTLLAVGTKRGYIYLLKPPNFEVVCSVLAAAKCIMSLTWHPRGTTLGDDCSKFRGYLTFGSFDKENVIKVYNCTSKYDLHNMKQVTVLKGHSGYIQFVAWSPHIRGRLISSSADFTVRVWDVTESTQLAIFHTGSSIVPFFCVWSPIDPDVLIAGYNERVVISWRISESSKLDPVMKVIKLRKGNIIKNSELVNGSEVVLAQNNEDLKENTQSLESDIDDLTLAKRNDGQKYRKEEKMFGRTWNPEIDSFQSCYALLKAHETESVPDYKFSFLKPPSDFFDHIKEEDQHFKKANNWSSRYQLALWRGNLNVILEEHMNTGHLDDFLISLAPFVSYHTWKRACEAYSKSLAEKKQYRKAASYLLAIHKLEEAIDMLVEAKMFLEAICVARCRVPDIYPLLPSLIRKYADWLAETGSTLRASECYIYLKEFSEAITVLAKKNQPEHLSLAALVSKRVGLDDLECEYSYRALVICLETEKFELASRICCDHPTIKKLSVLYETHQLITKLDSEQLTLEKDIVARLKELTGIDNDPDIYASLQNIFDRNNMYNSKKNMFLVLAHELSLACCAAEKDIILSHIIKALHTASKFVQKNKFEIPMVFKLISWLSPEGAAGYLSRGSIFGCDDENTSPKIISLRAYLCHGIAQMMRHCLDQKITNMSDMNEYPALLDRLMNYGLDKETFEYFKNQIEIKLAEKKINEAYKRKNEQKDNNGLDEEVPTKHNETESSETSVKDASEPEKVDKISEDDVIVSEREKMNGIKENIKEFEESRISSPNPVVVYCSLRDVLEDTEECEILSKLEKIFERLQKE